MSVKNVTFAVTKELAGQRLDGAMALAIGDLSRRKAKAIVDLGGVFVNRKRIRRASLIVQHGDVVAVSYRLDAPVKRLTLQKEALLFENHDLIAINKPPGLASQATKDQSVVHVVPCLEVLLGRKGGLHLLHRLDKETSGVLLIAKNQRAMSDITELFRRREMTKVYHALCFGQPPWEQKEMAAPLSTIDAKTGKVRVVKAGGKSALTKFEVLERFAEPNLSLIACYPKTGRSHQIRVHLEALGFPIIGDKKYGRGASLVQDLEMLSREHHFLHALTLGLHWPEAKDWLEFEAPYPPNFTKFLAAIKKDANE